jgi:hypothetical protein
MSRDGTSGYGSPSSQLAPTLAHSVIPNLTYTKTMARISTAAFCQGDLRQINCFKVCKLEKEGKGQETIWLMRQIDIKRYIHIHIHTDRHFGQSRSNHLFVLRTGIYVATLFLCIHCVTKFKLNQNTIFPKLLCGFLERLGLVSSELFKYKG